ncbi:MAG: hypothetical protein V1790_11240 [Planctomycetota bacterium]
MSDRRNSREVNGDGAISSLGVLFARVFGHLLGPMFLVLTTMCIVNSGSGWFTKLDGIFAGLAAVMIGSRWVEQRSGSATTAKGEPATMQDFRRYVRSVLLIATLAWVAANLLGNHVLH